MTYGKYSNSLEIHQENLVRLDQFLRKQPSLIGLLKQLSIECQDELLITAGIFGFGVPISENQLRMEIGAVPKGGTDPLAQKDGDIESQPADASLTQDLYSEAELWDRGRSELRRKND